MKLIETSAKLKYNRRRYNLIICNPFSSPYIFALKNTHIEYNFNNPQLINISQITDSTKRDVKLKITATFTDWLKLFQLHINAKQVIQDENNSRQPNISR